MLNKTKLNFKSCAHKYKVEKITKKGLNVKNFLLKHVSNKYCENIL